MKPVMQTVTGKSGNCFAACLASILELPITAVPNFCDAGPDDTDYWNACRAWLRQFGLGVMTLTFTNAAQWSHLRVGGYQIVSGPSPRLEGMHHATVWHQGRMAHDPHPDGTGIVAPEEMCVLYLIDPDRLQMPASIIAAQLRADGVQASAPADEWAGYKERCEHGVRWENRCGSCVAVGVPPTVPAPPEWPAAWKNLSPEAQQRLRDDPPCGHMFRGVRKDYCARCQRAATGTAGGQEGGNA